MSLVLIAEEPNDYIEAYLKHAASSSPGSSFHGPTGYQSLRQGYFLGLYPQKRTKNSKLKESSDETQTLSSLFTKFSVKSMNL